MNVKHSLLLTFTGGPKVKFELRVSCPPVSSSTVDDAPFFSWIDWPAKQIVKLLRNESPFNFFLKQLEIGYTVDRLPANLNKVIVDDKHKLSSGCAHFGG